MDIFNLSHLHELIAYLETHPHIGGLIAFSVALIESIPLLGGLIPGSVILTAIGMLIGSGALPVTDTLLWTMAGAFLGDCFSYGIGSYYNQRLQKMWPFRKYPQLLHKGEDFFKQHGGKSVFIGRFIGLVRGIVAMVAGMMHMRLWRFVCAALPAAVLWSVLYIVPGIVLGALSLELPPETATKFILIVLGVVACSSLILIGIHYFFRTLARAVDSTMQGLWRFLQKHRATRWLTTLLNTFHDAAHAHRQLTLLFFVLICAGVFIWLLCSMLHATGVTYFNQPVLDLLRTLRTPLGDHVMVAITLLGDKRIQFLAAGFIFVWLMWKHYRWLAVHWLAVVVMSAGLTQLAKTLYFSPRPTGIVHQQLTSAFPSGHMMLATALFGFLGMVFAYHLPPEKRKIPLFIAAFFILAEGLSRLYLNAHWLTDVLASLFLGLACASFVFLFYCRGGKDLQVHGGSGIQKVFNDVSCKAGKALYVFCHKKKHPVASTAIKKIITPIIVIYLLVWISAGAILFNKQLQNTTLYWPAVTTDTQTWWTQSQPAAPLYILSRLGKPRSALNVQWLDTLPHIQETLLKAGWTTHAIHLDWREQLNRLSPQTNPQHLPVLPALYQNQPPVLMMTKRDPQNNLLLHFILWKSNITLSDSQKTVWVGSVYYYDQPLSKKLLWSAPNARYQIYADAEQAFIAELNKKTVKWQIRKIVPNQIPVMMQDLNWDGGVVVIK